MSATECRDKSDEMLQDALLKFPGLLMIMLDKCGIRPDAKVSGHEYFGPAAVEGWVLRSEKKLAKVSVPVIF